jgi:hypothetical protein
VPLRRTRNEAVEMNIPWTYFALLVAAGVMNDAARIVTGFQDSSAGFLHLPNWATSDAGRISLSLLCIGGFLSMLATFIYGFFIAKWYLVFLLTLVALILSVSLIYIRLVPRNPILRPFYGYALMAVAASIHFLNLRL